jgi:hypothetical protein
MLNWLGHAIAIICTGLLILQVWTGTSWIVGRRTRGRGLDDVYLEHFIYRDEHPRGFWLMIGIQTLWLAFIWWTVLR